MNRRYLIAVVAVILIIIACVGISYLNSTYLISVKYTDVHDVTIDNISESQVGGTSKTIATVTKSGDSVRVNKGVPYYVRYKGNTNYADGFVSVSDTDNNVTIIPDYSSAKYTELMDSVLPDIITLLKQKYPIVESTYTIKPVAMKARGEWLVARLDYKGNYSNNTDTLRALFHKNGNTWELVAEPDILFTEYKQKNTPLDILTWANDAF